jgi:ABC transporter substrate binding protein (PQQ-dependent alcohol dehydrogenase system)
LKTYQLSRLPLILAFLGSSLALSGTAAENHTTAKKSDNPPKTAKQPDRALTLVYLTTNLPSRIPRPFFDPEIKGLGSQGAALGVDDNNTTGRFTGQSFTLKTVAVEDPATLETQFKSLLADQQSYFLMDLPTDVMLSLSKLPEAKDSIVMDVANGDDRLRGPDCQNNIFFLMPSNAMRSDALAQYLGKKRWQKWFLAIGPTESDRLLAESFRHSARKFGAKIIKEATWSYTYDDRRSPESEIPVFTQGEDYDLMLVADAQNQFADLFPYRTWQPKLVAGSAGLTATAWHRTHDAWGALQLQNRFKDKFARPMLERDYLAWLAARSLGEAATRGHSTNAADIKRTLLDPSFQVAGFKGVPLSFRSWDHQMRQPILLGAERSVVAVAPIDGYLHPENSLDTLGTDEPESSCSLKQKTALPSP